MIYTAKGDVFSSGATLIAHGCNTRGAFGAGVALAVARKYPSARNHYMAKHKGEGWQLGDVQFVVCKDTTIANCATQRTYSPVGRCHVNYDAVRECMEKVKKYAIQFELTVAIPKIGAGLAGGDWGIIKKILKEVFVNHDCTVYYL